MAVEIGKLHRRGQRNPPLVHQLQNIGDEVGEADITVYRIPETIMLKDAIVRELLPNIKLDTFRYSLDFIIRPDKGE